MKAPISQKSVAIQVIRLLVGFIAIFAMQAATAQHVITSSYIEQTHISPKLGYSIGYQFGDTHIEVGVFNQNAMTSNASESGTIDRQEKNFAGVYMNYPMLEKDALSLSFKIRTGVSNGENFVITPAINGNYKLFKKIMITGGLGVRAFRPTLISGIKITI